MELARRTLPGKIKHLVGKVSSDNLLLLSSSISYYSALALAPFILILLWVASLLGQEVQVQIIEHANANFSPQVAGMLELIFKNVEKGQVSVGSIPGIVGLGVLLFTCSIVFLQFRFAFDVIYGHHNPHDQKSIFATLRERLFAMSAVLFGVLLLISSFAAAAVIEYMLSRGLQENEFYRAAIMGINFFIYFVLFTALHRYTPSRKQTVQKSMKMGAFSSVFFMIGNIVLAYYLRNYAKTNVYGAAGTLLVFLIWAYYSSFIIFLSVEIFQHMRSTFRTREEKIKKRPARLAGRIRHFLR